MDSCLFQVMESVNVSVKTWRYLGKTLPSVQIPYIGDELKIVCGLYNKITTPTPPHIDSGTFDDNIAMT